MTSIGSVIGTGCKKTGFVLAAVPCAGVYATSSVTRVASVASFVLGGCAVVGGLSAQRPAIAVGGFLLGVGSYGTYLASGKCKQVSGAALSSLVTKIRS
jgi:hypothetical protein